MIRAFLITSSLLLHSVTVSAQGQSQGQAEYQLRVDGLACAYCAYGIEKAFMNTEGVENIDIDFEHGLVRVTTAPSTRFTGDQLETITDDAGFTLRSWKRVDGS